MAQGALRNSKANLSIAITGIAGPTGGSKLKPIGTIFFSFARLKKSVKKPSLDDHIKEKIVLNFVIFKHMAQFEGNRSEIREKALLFALNQLLTLTL